jgi:hypothetical protein
MILMLGLLQTKLITTGDQSKEGDAVTRLMSFTGSIFFPLE